MFEELENSGSVEDGRKEKIADELGDLFFSLLMLPVFGVDETVLNSTVEKFIRRFRYIDAGAVGRDYTFPSRTWIPGGKRQNTEI